MAFPKPFSRSTPAIAAALAWLLAFQCMQAPGTAQESTLEVAVLAGDGFRNETDNLRTWEVAVRVQDRDGHRIRGAAVFFEIPPGFGTFVGGLSSVMVLTDDDGVARVRGFQRGSQVGAFDITVSASFQGIKGSARIHQSNAAHSLVSIPHKALIVGGILATAGAVAYALTKVERRTTVSLGPGTVTRH
jgi:hypothetical protein